MKTLFQIGFCFIHTCSEVQAKTFVMWKLSPLQLGGIILPHQRVCRVPPQSGDTPVDLPDTELYDYPSVGQIAQALREQNIIPIFAAQEDVMDFYTVSLIVQSCHIMSCTWGLTIQRVGVTCASIACLGSVTVEMPFYLYSHCSQQKILLQVCSFSDSFLV